MAKVYRFSFKRLEVNRAAVEHFGWTAGVAMLSGLTRRHRTRAQETDRKVKSPRK